MGSFPATPLVVDGTTISVGVASWTDPTFTAKGVFYPDDVRAPEARLRYYCSRFPIVEVDSPFYALPKPATAADWVERSPEGFCFDVKANALMTGHATEVRRLPAELREALPQSLKVAKRVYAHELPAGLDDEVWRVFRTACEPLHRAGRLGAVLLQYAPWVAPTRAAPAMLEGAIERLPGIPIAVEFRNAEWMSERLRDRTLGLLQRLGLSYVAVDEPQGTPTSIPPVVEVTQPRLLVLRLHGQRADTWAARGVPAVEKYRYLYSAAELRPWVDRILAKARETERVHVIFNNCYANYGAVNAAEMIAMLAAATH